MHLTPESVAEEYDRIHARAETVVPLVNDVRDELGRHFDTDVASIDDEQYHDAIDAVFADGDRAVNVAALAGILRDLDVQDDYPGFVVDELLGRELAAMVAGGQPLRLLAEATFHYADVRSHTDGPAGVDDLDAALAAGVQTRLPGWAWTERESPFAVDG
ncbi:hypothetical protein [Halospeciosus flavus]|uniref:DUF7984 domain-containing protein n=1 Tax=Halospeciosus flavus TaxID=3032283 RepID=A0ABD5Z548_9EURY|nr:hypothetical protein [Halospeciosus flavus]